MNRLRHCNGENVASEVTKLEAFQIGADQSKAY